MNLPTYYTMPGIRKGDIQISFGSRRAEQIKARVLERYAYSWQDVSGKARYRDLVFVRHLIMYLLRKKTSMSLNEIGRMFNRDHSSVINAMDCIEKYLFNDFNGRRKEIQQFL
jgi:chromosomal replication initiation ATPase DnaA